jgi:acetyltransferase-like isoleucine patch superfamily enzyme
MRHEELRLSGILQRLRRALAGQPGGWLVVERGSLRVTAWHRLAQPISILEQGTGVTAEAGAELHAGTRIELRGGSVNLAAGACIGEGVTIRAGGPVRIGRAAVVEDRVLLASDLPDAPLEIGEGTRIGRSSSLHAHRGPLRIGAHGALGHANTWIATGGGIAVADRCDFTHAVTLDSASGSIEMGEGSGVGPNSILYGHGGLRIGRHCAIAGLVMIVPANHGTTRLDQPIRRQAQELAPIEIGDDVWIGGGACVLAGATIGDGAVVGAGAVVRSSVAPRDIVAGVPARAVGQRGSR